MFTRIQNATDTVRQSWFVAALMVGMGFTSSNVWSQTGEALDAIPKVGDQAPDFELRSVNGKTVSLQQTLKQGPAVLVVLRGYPGYQCPICSRQVAELIRKADQFAAKQVQVLMVYPGPADELTERAREFLADVELPDAFSVLVDPDYAMVNAYQLRWDEPRETAYPTTLVIDQEGVIRYAKVSRSHGGRANTEEVVSSIP